MENSFLPSVIKEFKYYKQLADKSFRQLNDEQLFWKFNEQTNSIAVIVRHMSGNMLSRFTNFLNEDGEKEWRDRDAEFDSTVMSRGELMKQWETGWATVLQSVENLKNDDLESIIYIRNQGHTVTEAINRQVAHYAYHVGQIVFIAKMIAVQWESLSIPLNASKGYNEEKFAKEKMRQHFTEEILKKDPETEV